MTRREQIETIRQRYEGRMTATEIMLRHADYYDMTDEKIAEHVATFIYAPLIGPYGRVMP